MIHFLIYAFDSTPFIRVEEYVDQNCEHYYHSINSLLDEENSSCGYIINTWTRQSDGLITNVRKTSINKYIEDSYSYDSNGTKLLTSIDNENKFTNYVTDSIYGVHTQITKPSGKTVSYVFDSDCQYLLSTSFNNSHTISNTYTLGKLTTLSQNSLNYNFDYEDGKIKTIKELSVSVSTTTYSNSDKEIQIVYPSYTQKNILDDYRRIDSIKINNIEKESFTYRLNPHFNSGIHTYTDVDNSSSLLAIKEDQMEGKIYKYGYDQSRRIEMIKTYETNVEVASESLTYDDISRPISDEICFGDESLKTLLVYKDSVSKVAASSLISSCTCKYNNITKLFESISYDYLKRVQEIITNFHNKYFKRELLYISNNKTSKRIVGYKDYLKINTAEYIEESNVSLSVDNDYNITQQNDLLNSNRKKQHFYDSYGRLARENNKELNKSIVYVYGNYGNITSVNTYAYSEGSLPDTPQSTKTYTYDSTKVDRLISHNGNTITYDTYGNPLKYKDYDLAYEYNRLKTLSTNVGTYTYGYNASGLRTDKLFVRNTSIPNPPIYVTLSSSTYEYDNSNKLIKEIRSVRYNTGTITNIELLYLYDTSGISGVIYNNGSMSIDYYFKNNIFGDIEEIYDSNGALKVKYAYDAFGNCSIIQGSSETIANLNPFRYRGYYYDTDTGLYYLTTRYYDPDTCRFISPDDTDYLSAEDVSGLNRYVYCNNNPVNYNDHSGHIAVSTFLIGLGISTLIGAIVGATSYTLSESVSYGLSGEWSWSWAQFAGSVIGGAIGGACSMIPGISSIAVAGFTGALSTGIGMLLQNQWEDADYTGEHILVTSAISGLSSALAAGIFDTIPIKGLNRGRGSYKAITKQINKKFINGSIRHIRFTTFYKMSAYNFYGSLIGTGLSGILDASDERYLLTVFICEERKRQL